MLGPCHLELTLLSAFDRCGCGWPAHQHRHWTHNNPEHVNYDRNKATQSIASVTYTQELWDGSD